MQWFRKVLVILFLLLTCSSAMAFTGELLLKGEVLGEAIEEYKEYVSYLKGGDAFYVRLTQIGLDTRTTVKAHCPYSEIDEYRPIDRIVNSRSCLGTLELKYPGSSYTPIAGGYIRAGNFTVYLTPAPKYDFTKIVYGGDYTIQAAVLFNDPVLKKIVYNVYVRIGNREAVFTLQKDGIKEIQNISTIYDIQKKFLTAGTQVTENQLLFDLVKYYQFLKSQKKGLSSFDFIQSMLLDLKAQSDFVKFAIAIQQEGKK